MIYNGASITEDYFIRSDLSDLPATVRRCVRHLRPVASDFDSIVVTGMSGVVVGAPVAVQLGKPVVIVRKPHDMHHNGELVVNEHRLGERWLWLDDFLASGETWKRISEALAGRGTCVGRYLYDANGLEGDLAELCDAQKEVRQANARIPADV